MKFEINGDKLACEKGSLKLGEGVYCMEDCPHECCVLVNSLPEDDPKK